MKNFQTQKNYSKQTGGYNAALAVPGHGLYALLVLVLAPQIGLVVALLLVIAPYMYLSAKIYQRQQRSDYQLHMATVRSQKRRNAMPKVSKLTLTPLLSIKKPKLTVRAHLAPAKAPIFNHQ
ncbi:MAG: hypothetical protein WAS36_05235 [Candidatus Saccharimonadales bacterium]